MTNPIDDFRGRYRWLSNFWLVDVTLDDEVYPSTEHAYQAAKTLVPAARARFRSGLSCREARQLGQRIQLRPGWDTMRIAVMTDLNAQKFRRPDLREALRLTGNAELIEGNTWGDRFWGVYDGSGENWLGQILMLIRDQILTVGATRH